MIWVIGSTALPLEIDFFDERSGERAGDEVHLTIEPGIGKKTFPSLLRDFGKDFAVLDKEVFLMECG